MPKLSANLSWLFTELDFEDRFQAAAHAGFRGVECLFPYATPAARVARLLEAGGLEMALINAPPGDWESGDRGLGAVDGRQGDFMDSIEAAVAYAGAVGCRRVHVMAGIGGDRAVFVDNLRIAADICGRAGIKALIEPLNEIDMPGYFLGSAAQAMEIIWDVGSPNLGLQLDLYHVHMWGGDGAAAIDDCAGQIGHVQIAGAPGRAEPDSGALDYGPLLERLDNTGYDGWIGCEYRPRDGTLAGLGWASAYGIG